MKENGEMIAKMDMELKLGVMVLFIKDIIKKEKKNGIGEYLWADGSKFLGNWKDNRQEGFGIYEWSDKKKYEGYFQNNILEGEGHYKWIDGRDYYGTFNKGKRQELGKYIWNDGRSYTGFWENGKQNGLGLYINEKNDEKFGIWVIGKRNRWLTAEEINALKEENDAYFEQIMNFDINKYQFIEEKKRLNNAMNRNNN